MSDGKFHRRMLYCHQNQTGKEPDALSKLKYKGLPLSREEKSVGRQGARSKRWTASIRLFYNRIARPLPMSTE